jgi:hypothetical protein
MQSKDALQAPGGGPFPAFEPIASTAEYLVDAAQRSVLFWDVMRQRGNQYKAHEAEAAPHVLDYPVELLIDGRKLERPVNYALVRIIPASIAGPLSSSILVPDTGPVSADSRPTAKSGSPWLPDIPATSSAFCPTRCRARPSRTLRTRKPYSSRR